MVENSEIDGKKIGNIFSTSFGQVMLKIQYFGVIVPLFLRGVFANVHDPTSAVDWSNQSIFG